MRTTKHVLVFISFAITTFLLSSCSSLIGAGMNALERSISEKSEIRLVQTYTFEQDSVRYWLNVLEDPAEKKHLSLTSSKLPGISLSGPWQADTNFVDLAVLTGFFNWNGGWSEFEQPISGRLTVELLENSITIKALSTIEKMDISKGKIRLGNTIVSGSQALGALVRRQNRIIALAEFMRSTTSDEATIESEKSFKAYWAGFLIPEYQNPDMRDQRWKYYLASAPADAVKKFAEGIEWHTGYSTVIMPPYLAAIRDQGGVLRDWEEAYEWLIAEYRWPEFMADLEPGITLTLKTQE